MKTKAMDETKGNGPDSALNGRGPVRQAAAVGDDVRWERVARLREAIQAGTYGVPAEALAERLMEHMLEAGREEPLERGL